ncbi:hypothetical protein [Glaciecola sp. 1036]|uniref:hypothetical protein n=1 Tax=Alteromonadaceae TaxID=72275 RepID=UPI003CFFD258
MFEQVAAIDWSGAKSPQRSFAVSLAVCQANSTDAPVAIPNKMSRTDIYHWISEQIVNHKKTLVGIDCNLGYAANVVKNQFGNHMNYWQLWSEIENICSAEGNFFAGKFWTHEVYGETFWTQGKKPDWFDTKLLRRKTEHAAVSQGFGDPESPFKLIGAKQVGKGGLAGMRVMHKLKSEFGDKIAIWPFEAGLINSATVVVSENFPRTFIRKAGMGNQKLRTLEDLNQALAYFNTRPYFTSDSINDHLTDAIIAAAGMRWVFENETPLNTELLPEESTQIEGWIFAVAPEYALT